MKDYTKITFDKQRQWIKDARINGWNWEEIKFGKGKDVSGLAVFLENKKINDFWKIDTEDWENLVRMEKEGEEARLNIDLSERNSIIANEGESNELMIPERHDTCWQKYKKHLLDDTGLLWNDVQNMEISTGKILKHLNSDTKGSAVKGLVIGNVQSGKTANMAALMSMAADNGWNLFIVLSGTIENLRVQTQNRLVEDLNQKGTSFNWHGISKPSRNSEAMEKTHNCDFSRLSHSRYLVVSLKNSSRLRNLIQWIHEDENTARQMKILIIDDESDQASVNTKKVDNDERTKINDLLINLVSNKDENGKEKSDIFRAMNYIGYTATPYANVLNEADKVSLYPHDFISTLHVSKQYFGPQQIFGDRVSELYGGLDIVREIENDDISGVKEIHEGSLYCPKALEDAICWFLCCAATFRYWGITKPVSMLIHTSQKQAHHETVSNSVYQWFEKNKKSIISKCEMVWNTETNNFKKDDLFQGYKDIAVKKEDVRDYPVFDDLTQYINELTGEITNIKLGDEGDFKYSRGIHICVDNCKNNSVFDDGTYLRLTYPDKKAQLGFSPAFIVIGGATLSRGLTIEGLVSTFFMRTTKQADTLMQMGRWFGYKKGYELLQRIWITETARKQFVFLAELDTELRTNIANMDLFNKKPREYPVIVKNTPSLQLIRISAPQKTQSAITAQMDYSGANPQTHLFYDDNKILKDNYDCFINFINSLGVPESKINNGIKGANVWRDIDFNYICEHFLIKYQFHDRLGVFGDIEAIREWVDNVTQKGELMKWNIVLYGITTGPSLEMEHCSVKKIVRTRRSIRKNIIDIGVLSDPKEKVADVDSRLLSEEGRIMWEEYIKRDGPKREKALKIREDAGLGKTPTIGLYIIDKDSKASGASTRHDLKASVDVVGVVLNIPGNKINGTHAESVMIDLSKYNFDTDVEGTEDEN